MANRIQSNCHTGKGDLGTSNLISGWTIRKSSHICRLQNEIEVLRNLFSEYLLNYGRQERFPIWGWIKRFFLKLIGKKPSSKLDYSDYELLWYYKLHLHNLSALVYYRFNEVKYVSSTDHLETLDNRLKDIAEDILPAQDFIIPETRRSLALDRIRVQVRKVEHLMWVVIDTLYGEFHDDYNESICRTAREFNLLSNYLYNLNRYEGLKEDQPELYWRAR